MARIRTLLLHVYHSLYFPPTVICISIIVVTLFAWRSTTISLNQDVEAATNAHIHATEQDIHTNLAAYEEILQGSVGLFRGSSEVTKDDWTHYLQTFDFKNTYNGAQGIGFLRVTPTNQIPQLANFMATQGVPNFAVIPATNDSVVAPVTYAESIASAHPPLYGYDMYAEPTRRNALYLARDKAETTITGRITLVASGEQGNMAGFDMYVPYYQLDVPAGTVNDRRTALRGYTYAGFRATVLFSTVATNADNGNAGFRITVAGDTSGQPLYQSAHFDNVRKQPRAVLTSRALHLYGQTWNMQYAFNRSGLVSNVQLRRPPALIAGGTFVALLIAAIVYLLLRGRASELTAQKERAVELAKDELLSLASHQLRTPATGVKQYVGMVLQGFAGKVPAKQQQLLEKAYASNDRQLQIINEILHLAKIEAGRIVLAPTPTNINGLISDIISEQQPDIEAARHRLRVSLPKHSITLSVDAHMLRMAIENVLSNAVKYTRSGGRISVKLQKKHGHITIRITDNGVGIAESNQAELFKQFTRFPNEMSHQVGGTGIGLYLAKHLVELHGGIITVESTVGKGSTFVIVLPNKK